MYKRHLFVLVLFFNGFLIAQKSDIVFRSKASHNYAIGNYSYIEDAVDTAALMFMGTVKITSSNQDVFISRAQNLLEMRTKDLNANSYKIKSIALVDTTLTLFFDVYFASDKQLALNEKSKIKDRFIYFNNIKDTIFRTVFINDHPLSFLRKKHLQVTNVTNREVCSKLDTTSAESKCKEMKSGENAFFYSVKIKENKGIYVVPLGAAPVLIVAAIATTAIGLANKYINPNQEKFTHINYNLGRMLMEIYPLDKEVKLD